MGRLFLEKYNQRDATRQLNAALAINPNGAEIHAARAELALQSFNLDRAAVGIERQILIDRSRRRNSRKRGSGEQPVPIDSVSAPVPEPVDASGSSSFPPLQAKRERARHARSARKRQGAVRAYIVDLQSKQRCDGMPHDMGLIGARPPRLTSRRDAQASWAVLRAGLAPAVAAELQAGDRGGDAVLVVPRAAPTR